jgi:hypothetical protein
MRASNQLPSKLNDKVVHRWCRLVSTSLPFFRPPFLGLFISCSGAAVWSFACPCQHPLAPAAVLGLRHWPICHRHRRVAIAEPRSRSLWYHRRKPSGISASVIRNVITTHTANSHCHPHRHIAASRWNCSWALLSCCQCATCFSLPPGSTICSIAHIGTGLMPSTTSASLVSPKFTLASHQLR